MEQKLAKDIDTIYSLFNKPINKYKKKHIYKSLGKKIYKYSGTRGMYHSMRILSDIILYQNNGNISHYKELTNVEKTWKDYNISPKFH